MNRLSGFSFALLLLWALPSALPAQDSPPPGLARVELARSRDCVERLARMADVSATLEPIAQRLARLNALGRAVSLEDAGGVVPFDSSHALESAVARWFASDSALAVQYLASPDSALLEERADRRAAILEQIDSAIEEEILVGQKAAQEGAPVRAEAQACEGAIFVRSAVLEACENTESPLCEAAAAAPSAEGSGPFVESPEDLWDVEQYRPWTDPVPLQPGPEGGLIGARTSAMTRRGNTLFSLSLAPLLQERAQLTEEEIQAARSALDSLEFTFDHPSFVMVPGFELTAQLPPPLGEETHFVLHFGDLTGDDVIWSLEAGRAARVQISIPATPEQLERLRAGDPVSLTALRVDTGGEETEAAAVYSLTLLQVGQAANTDALLTYMGDGSLSRDLETLFSAGTGTGTGSGTGRS